MENYNFKFIILTTICLSYNAAINAKESCDCDVIQIYDPEIPNQYHNFTYSYNDSNGPVYSSSQNYHLSWNNKEESWYWDLFAPHGRFLLSCTYVQHFLSIKHFYKPKMVSYF